MNYRLHRYYSYLTPNREPGSPIRDSKGASNGSPYSTSTDLVQHFLVLHGNEHEQMKQIIQLNYWLHRCYLYLTPNREPGSPIRDSKGASNGSPYPTTTDLVQHFLSCFHAIGRKWNKCICFEGKCIVNVCEITSCNDVNNKGFSEIVSVIIDLSSYVGYLRGMQII